MSSYLRDSLRGQCAGPPWTQADFEWALNRVKLLDSYGDCYIRLEHGQWTFWYSESVMTLEQRMEWPIKPYLSEDEVLSAVTAGIQTYDGKKPVFRRKARRGYNAEL